MCAAAVGGGKAADVIVVGAGVTGTSIAWRLAETGRRVLLLDRRGVCSGASGRNGGMTGAGSSMHAASRAGKAVYALTTANLRLLKGLARELDADFSRRIIADLLDLIRSERSQRLILCASPRMLGELRNAGAELHRGALVVEEIPRDLVKLTPAQLRDQLESYGLLPAPPSRASHA